MVLEELYTLKYLKDRTYFAFLLGIAYSIIGMAFAVQVFKTDPALVAVAVISIFLLPTLYQLSIDEELLIKKARSLTLWSLLNQNKSFVLIYLWLFIGIFLVFAFFSLVLPSLAGNYLFKQQLAIHTGRAAFSMPTFQIIFMNNIQVLLLCFVISLIGGTSSIFLIVWNASVWGTIFGSIAKSAASAIAGNPFIIFVLVLILVLPHTLMEALGYIFGVLSGTTISHALVREKFGSEGMHRVLTQGLLLLFVAGAIILIAGIWETFLLSCHPWLNAVIHCDVYQKIRMLSPI